MVDIIEQKIDRLTQLVERNSVDIATLTTTVDKLAAAVAEDIAELDEKIDALDAKADTNHLELTNKLAGIDRRLDTEALERGDQKIPARVGDLETKVFGHSRAPQSV